MIYLDNAATTKPFEEVLATVSDAFSSFGNPSSRHSLGYKAKSILNDSRALIMKLIGGANGGHLYFTSGGTESNNILINSMCKLFPKGRIISTVIEHESILETLRLKKEAGYDVVLLPVTKNGYVRLCDLKKAITKDTFLVSVQYINNEIGTTQRISKIGAICRKNHIFFHSDCVQAVGHVSLNVEQMNLDFITASAHKFNGIKGSGFLYSKIPLPTTIGGGGQENNVRPGTENTIGIIAMAKALSISLDKLTADQKHISQMVYYLEKELKSIPGISLNVNNHGYHSIVNFYCRSMDNESLLAILDTKQIYCSSGSACLSNGNNLSHVLSALGYSKRHIMHSLRLSLSSLNSLDECRIFICALRSILSLKK